MAILNISSYTSEKKQGIHTLKLTTTSNHNLAVDYTNIQITGATDPVYNGIFRFKIINETVLECREGVEVGSSQSLTVITGTITATVLDYTTLSPQEINSKSNLYKITQNGYYKILLDESKIYNIHYTNIFSNAKIGERLNDDDRILYATQERYPNAVGLGAKWLIVEVEKIVEPAEIRLVSLN